MTIHMLTGKDEWALTYAECQQVYDNSLSLLHESEQAVIINIIAKGEDYEG